MKKDHTFAILAYKESPYLEECIKSVMKQNKNSETLIMTQTPNNYISKIAKKYNLEIVEIKSKGIGNAFDFALEYPKTKYVTICHQDDVYFDDYYNKVVKKMDDNTIIAFSDYYEFKNNHLVKTNTNLKIKRILLFPLKFFKKSIFVRRRSLSLGCCICCPAVSFNKDKVKTPLFQNDEFRSDVDWQAWEILSKQKGKFLYISEALMFHRVHDDSETSKVIADNKRTTEDLVMFKKFWPNSIAKFICKIYSNSEKSNSE